LVIDHLRNDFNSQNVGIAFVYFDYKSQGKQTTEYCLRSILKQLLLFLDVLPDEVDELYDKCSESSTSPEIEILTSLIALSVSRLSPVFVILDGLDECDHKTIVPYLVRPMRTLDIKIICTSRPHLLKIHDQLGATNILEISAHPDDVKVYLNTRLDKEWFFDESLKIIIAETLSKKIQGK
jgi:hypothetical protein